jgi:CYTH domain-containing protein
MHSTARTAAEPAPAGAPEGVIVAATMEIERKFVVGSLPSGVADAGGVDIAQGYLAADDANEVRLRRKGDACLLTVKTGHGLSRVEREVALTGEQLDALWPATEGRRVVKTRFEAPVEGHTAEIDRYRGALAGLVTVEVEFESVEAAAAFEPPGWFGREVTGDPRYANRRLAVDGRP